MDSTYKNMFFTCERTLPKVSFVTFSLRNSIPCKFGCNFPVLPGHQSEIVVSSTLEIYGARLFAQKTIDQVNEQPLLDFDHERVSSNAFTLDYEILKYGRFTAHVKPRTYTGSFRILDIYLNDLLIFQQRFEESSPERYMLCSLYALKVMNNLIPQDWGIKNGKLCLSVNKQEMQIFCLRDFVYAKTRDITTTIWNAADISKTFSVLASGADILQWKTILPY